MRYALAVGVLALLAAPQAAALETWTELPADTTSSIGARVGSGIGVARLPRTFNLGADWDLALNGPLMLHIGGGLGIAGDVLTLHVAPGIRYLFPMDGLTWLPYGKAALAVDLLGGEGSDGNDVAVGLKLAAGMQYFFHPSIAVGPELAFTSGVAAGDDGSGGAFRVDASLSVVYRLP